MMDKSVENGYLCFVFSLRVRLSRLLLELFFFYMFFVCFFFLSTAVDF